MNEALEHLLLLSSYVLSGGQSSCISVFLGTKFIVIIRTPVHHLEKA